MGVASGERFGSGMAAPRPYDGFDSCWSWVRGLPVHDRRSTAAAGAPVVLVHGLAVSHRYLMPFARSLAARYRVHVIDLPGFRLSGEPGRVLDCRSCPMSSAPGWTPSGCAGRCSTTTRSAARWWWTRRAAAGRRAGAGADRPDDGPARPHARTPARPHARKSARPQQAVQQAVRWLRNLWHEDPSSFL